MAAPEGTAADAGGDCRKCAVGLLGAVLEFELVVLVDELGLVVTLELVSLLLVALAFKSNGVGGTLRFELFPRRLQRISKACGM